MFTTSRYSSNETKEKTKKLAGIFSSVYVSRGKKPLSELVEKARNDGERRICIAEEKNKKFSRLRIVEVKSDGSWEWLSDVGFYEERN